MGEKHTEHFYEHVYIENLVTFYFLMITCQATQTKDSNVIQA